MNRLWLTLGLLLGCFASGVDAERIDLLAEAQACQDQWQAEQEYPDFFDETFESDRQPAEDESKFWGGRAYELLADSEDAGEHLFRAWMSKRDPLLLAEPLQRAFELDPDNPFILSSLAEFCLRDEFSFCAEVAERLTTSPDSTAEGLIIAAALNNRSGQLETQELYELASQRQFSNGQGQQIEIIWPLVQRLGPDTSEHEQVILMLGIGMAISSSYFSELTRVCAPRLEEPPFKVEPEICQALAQTLVNNGPSMIDRMVGVSLLNWWSKNSQDLDDLEQASQAKQSVDDLSNRWLGLFCSEDNIEYYATEQYLFSIVDYGEVNTIRALIEEVEGVQN